jgi:hypothetical protein
LIDFLKRASEPSHKQIEAFPDNKLTALSLPSLATAIGLHLFLQSIEATKSE